MRAEGDADAGGACFVLARRAAAVFSGEHLYVLLCCKGDVLSFDGRALHGKIALCCDEVCFFPCSDFAACIFPCDALGAAVGFARAKAEVQGESCGIFQRVLSLAEGFMDEAASFPCVDGFQAVVLHFAEALQRCGDLLSEAQESMPEADGQSRRSALLCQDIAVDIFPAVDLGLLCRDARNFSCEDAGRCEVRGISGCDLDVACKACDVRSRLCKRGAVALALDLLRADGEAESAGGEDAGSLFFLEAVRMGVVLFRCRSEVSSCSDIRVIVREDVCRLQRHVLFGGEIDVPACDERAARLVRRIVDADGCPGARQEAACRMAMTVVIFGSFASCGEGDVLPAVRDVVPSAWLFLHIIIFNFFKPFIENIW